MTTADTTAETDRLTLAPYFDLLGHLCRDRVSGHRGVADTVSFDLYGCVQVTLNGGFDEKGERRASHWFDFNRLELVGDERVMTPPDFRLDRATPERTWEHGPADKPDRRHEDRS